MGRALDAGQPQMQAILFVLFYFLSFYEHWMPVQAILFVWSFSLNLLTRVCQLPFRYVIKYENLAEEWPHLLHRFPQSISLINFFTSPTHSLEVSDDERMALELPWENRGPQGSLKEGYLDKLPEETLLKLFNKVAADFTMFGYTIEDQY